jgi:hypothetical protein
LADETITEEQQQMVDLIASEFGMSESTARACLIAAGWDAAAAAKVAGLNRVDHLLINLRFMGKNPLPHGGLIAILLRRGSAKPERLIGLTLDGYEYIEDVSPYLPATDFIKSIVQPYKQQRENSPWYTLQQSILLNFSSESIGQLFKLMGDSRVSEFDSDGKLKEQNPLKDAVVRLIHSPIDDHFMESVKLETSIQPLNGFQYDNIKDLFTEESPPSGDAAGTKKLKGQLVIDPHHGIRVEELKEGDTIICDIIDTSPLSVEVGKMLGIYRRGVWFPARGKIISIEDTLSGTKKITMRTGHGIYVVTTALGSVRIKVGENELDSILRRIEYQRDETVRSAMSLLPLALVILGVALALTILLQRG